MKKIILSTILCITMINTQQVKADELNFKSITDVYAKLSNISFQTHIMQIQQHVKMSMITTNSDPIMQQFLSRKFLLNKKYQHSVNNVLGNMISQILTSQDEKVMSCVYISQPGKNEHYDDFRKGNLLYLPQFIVNDLKKLNNLTVSEWNYIILYNYCKKHTLKMLKEDGSIADQLVTKQEDGTIDRISINPGKSNSKYENQRAIF